MLSRVDEIRLQDGGEICWDRARRMWFALTANASKVTDYCHTALEAFQALTKDQG
jgi:hypothetical protein